MHSKQIASSAELHQTAKKVLIFHRRKCRSRRAGPFLPHNLPRIRPSKEREKSIIRTSKHPQGPFSLSPVSDAQRKVFVCVVKGRRFLMRVLYQKGEETAYHRHSGRDLLASEKDHLQQVTEQLTIKNMCWFPVRFFIVPNYELQIFFAEKNELVKTYTSAFVA